MRVHRHHLTVMMMTGGSVSDVTPVTVALLVMTRLVVAATERSQRMSSRYDVTSGGSLRVVKIHIIIIIYIFIYLFYVT